MRRQAQFLLASPQRGRVGVRRDALIVLPDGQPLPAAALAAPTTQPLTAVELLALLRGVPRDPLGVNPRVRISLAGVQGKLVLTRLPDGAWSQPLDGTPSTHILKLPIPDWPDSVANEAFCLRLAAALGLSVPEADLLTLDDLTVLVVRRYDRQVRADGVIERIHQEDGCQAFGVPPARKYQAQGGPALKAFAALLRQYDPEAIPRLLRLAVLNVLVGNADAHAKNLALLHPRPGQVRLGPCYDVLSTRWYASADDRLGMTIGGVQHVDRVTPGHLVAEARTWGMPRDEAERHVFDMLDHAAAAIEQARAQVPSTPAALARLVAQRLAALRQAQLLPASA